MTKMIQTNANSQMTVLDGRQLTEEHRGRRIAQRTPVRVELIIGTFVPATQAERDWPRDDDRFAVVGWMIDFVSPVTGELSTIRRPILAIDSVGLLD